MRLDNVQPFPLEMLSSFGGFLLSFANLAADTENADPSQQSLQIASKLWP